MTGALSRSFRRIRALAVKETFHMRRDPRVVVMGLVVPVLLLLLFGWGVRFDVEHVPLAVVDRARTETTRDLVRRFVATGEFDLAGELPDEEAVEAAFRSGRAAVALVFPEDFDRRLARGDEAVVQVLLDGADATSSRQAMGRLEVMAQVAAIRMAGGLRLEPPVEARTWMRYNPAGRSSLFLVPGLAGLVLAMVGVMLTALTVAREWETGSMEQLFATPVGRFEIVAGKLLPYLVLAGLQVLLLLVVGTWIFGVPVRGSLALLAGSSLLFMTGVLGQGLLVSIATRSQMLASQVAAVTSILPTMLLSGFLFPIENMPWPLQVVARLVPATYYISTLRGVLLRGAGLAELWPAQLALLAYAAAMVAFSTARFQRRLG